MDKIVKTRKDHLCTCCVKTITKKQAAELLELKKKGLRLEFCSAGKFASVSRPTQLKVRSVVYDYIQDITYWEWNNLELIINTDNMKAKVELIDQKETEYPVLKISNKDVVFFTEPNTGYVVASPTRIFGHHSTNWAEDKFRIFHGEIILKNE